MLAVAFAFCEGRHHTREWGEARSAARCQRRQRVDQEIRGHRHVGTGRLGRGRARSRSRSYVRPGIGSSQSPAHRRRRGRPTSDISAVARELRSIERGALWLAEDAARELPTLSLADALRARERPDAGGRASCGTSAPSLSLLGLTTPGLRPQCGIAWKSIMPRMGHGGSATSASGLVWLPSYPRIEERELEEAGRGNDA
jgi:hypothetical protein